MNDKTINFAQSFSSSSGQPKIFSKHPEIFMKIFTKIYLDKCKFINASSPLHQTSPPNRSDEKRKVSNTQQTSKRVQRTLSCGCTLIACGHAEFFL